MVEKHTVVRPGRFFTTPAALLLVLVMGLVISVLQVNADDPPPCAGMDIKDTKGWNFDFHLESGEVTPVKWDAAHLNDDGITITPTAALEGIGKVEFYCCEDTAKFIKLYIKIQGHGMFQVDLLTKVPPPQGNLGNQYRLVRFENQGKKEEIKDTKVTKQDLTLRVGVLTAVGGKVSIKEKFDATTTAFFAKDEGDQQGTGEKKDVARIIHDSKIFKKDENGNDEALFPGSPGLIWIPEN